MAGIIATFTATDTVAGQVLDPEAALSGYASVFQAIGLVAIVLGIVVGVFSFLLKKLGHGRAEDQVKIPAAAEAAGPEQDAHPKA